MNINKAEQNKAIRGHILFLLSISPTAPVPQSVLESNMITSMLVSNPDIAVYLDYLMDRGYIKRIESQTQKMVAYKLTSKGIDLMEGTIKDAGVLLNGGH